MSKRKLDFLCVILTLAVVGLLAWAYVNNQESVQEVYSDGVKKIDLNKIILDRSGVQVDFSEVIIGNHKESRKLIVSTQEAKVSTMLTDSLIKKLDFDFLKKTQNVSYAGTGYFVVDLDNLTKANVVQDKKNKIVTIRIDHAYLQTIEIDPNKIIIDEVKEGLLARGKIKLTVNDYNVIEKELRKRLEEKFDTIENGQNADATALRMVREVYEPIVKAIDSSYRLLVEFK